ncbi:MAG TPA: glutathione S-transferase family protein [Mariprofundaceae bacterium]|nr:glutathione S-transferase family protein [Mariprofundaceae bacterium]
MGMLVDGVWSTEWYDTKATKGAFVRPSASFRNWITPDGAPGPSGDGGFKAEAGRYHLYVSLACPWANRTLILRKLKHLEEIVSVDVVHPHMLEHGWEFREPFRDSLYGSRYLHELYTRADAHYSGRVSVPLLWDRERETIVNNESADIIRMFNSAFAAIAEPSGDYYPESRREEIDRLNDDIYEHVNNGVYRCGFATSQTAYEEAFDALFDALDRLETRLAGQRYLTGNQITEADWRLFTTLIRFDAVYHGHFKCNQRRIADYTHLYGYLRDLYQQPGVAETVDFDHIKQHYYYSHDMINPTRIVPKGPVQDLWTAHGREQLEAEP